MRANRFLLIAALPLCLCSCSSMDEGAQVVVPDRDKEGLTGPGIRMEDDIPKSAVNEPQPPRALFQKQQAVDGVDFFQYKKKF